MSRQLSDPGRYLTDRESRRYVEFLHVRSSGKDVPHRGEAHALTDGIGPRLDAGQAVEL
jgi:hypothetical protein